MQPLKLAVIGVLLITFACIMQAQVSIRVNIGTPSWGPQVQADVRYYYLPDVDAYYDINTSLFIYCNNGSWIHRRNLPGRFRNYDLYRGHKVVVHDYHGNEPYSYCNYHKNRDRRYKEYERTGMANHRNYENNYRSSREDHNRKSDKNRFERNMKFAHGNDNGHNKDKNWKD